MVLCKSHLYDLFEAKESFLGIGDSAEVQHPVATRSNWLNQRIVYPLRCPYGKCGDKKSATGKDSSKVMELGVGKKVKKMAVRRSKGQSNKRSQDMHILGYISQAPENCFWLYRFLRKSLLKILDRFIAHKKGRNTNFSINVQEVERTFKSLKSLPKIEGNVLLNWLERQAWQNSYKIASLTILKT